MTFLFSWRPSLRLRPTRGRLVCRISLPVRRFARGACHRELVLVASPLAPRLRRLTVYRRLADPLRGPDEPPRTA